MARVYPPIFRWTNPHRWACASSKCWRSSSTATWIGAEPLPPISVSSSQTESNHAGQNMNSPTLNRHKKATILVAEDEAIVRADVEDYLKSFGYRVAASVASGEEAKRL